VLLYRETAAFEWTRQLRKLPRTTHDRLIVRLIAAFLLGRGLSMALSSTMPTLDILVDLLHDGLRPNFALLGHYFRGPELLGALLQSLTGLGILLFSRTDAGRKVSNDQV
jgi:hypothetical protein